MAAAGSALVAFESFFNIQFYQYQALTYWYFKVLIFYHESYIKTDKFLNRYTKIYLKIPKYTNERNNYDKAVKKDCRASE